MNRQQLLIVCGDPSNNLAGRAQAVHRVAVEAGYNVQLVSPVTTSPLWAPLAGSDFDRSLIRMAPAALRRLVRETTPIVVAIKPRQDSLGVIWRTTTRTGTPLILDVDDPDLEMLRADILQVSSLQKAVKSPGRYLRYLGLARATRRSTCVTSNPVLQRRYGGLVLPHARPDRGPGAPHSRRSPTIAFIGTPKEHKGIDVLRAAVAQLAPWGYSLVITASRPLSEPTRAWETWTGALSEDDSMQILKSSDIVAIPSLPGGWGDAQLPMKVIDAMLAGRAVIASSLEPLSWALGGTGLLVEPGSVAQLVRALEECANPATRTRLGNASRQRALASFTPQSLAPVLRSAVDLAVRRRSPAEGQHGRPRS